MAERVHYGLLAELFEYPTAGLPSSLRRLAGILRDGYPEAADALDRFLELLPATNQAAMQELFVRSFEVQAITTLDVGYVMFGDDYKRGQLLAHLSREHRNLDNDCGKELADHLPNVLRLIAKHPDDELVQELVEEIVGPALASMIGEFSVERITQKSESYKKHYKTLIDMPVSGDGLMLYRLALTALQAVVEQDFTLAEIRLPEAASDFLAAVQRENAIEEEAGAQG